VEREQIWGRLLGALVVDLGKRGELREQIWRA
jgi:hypothetical protein